jgi:hypothetical protein
MKKVHGKKTKKEAMAAKQRHQSKKTNKNQANLPRIPRFTDDLNRLGPTQNTTKKTNNPYRQDNSSDSDDDDESAASSSSSSSDDDDPSDSDASMGSAEEGVFASLTARLMLGNNWQKEVEANPSGTTDHTGKRNNHHHDDDDDRSKGALALIPVPVSGNEGVEGEEGEAGGSLESLESTDEQMFKLSELDYSTIPSSVMSVLTKWGLTPSLHHLAAGNWSRLGMGWKKRRHNNYVYCSDGSKAPVRFRGGAKPVAALLADGIPGKWGVSRFTRYTRYQLLHLLRGRRY